MVRSRVICAWIVIVAVLLAGPVGSLAECLRCPPDCPMHAAAVERDADDQSDARPDAAAHHEHGAHGGHGAAHEADAAKPKKCHEAPAPAPKPDDGPCLSGVCGHMDPSHARLLPEGVLGRPKPLAPALVTELATTDDASAPAARAVPPPTEPPRPLSA